MIYTGIGSRETPEEYITIIKIIAQNLAMRGYTLRSGGANGADTAFETGCDIKIGQKEIYLPWFDFNHNRSNLYEISDEAKKLAEKFHPKWSSLKEGAKKLHSRNVYQILGIDLKTPSDFVVCYTENGNGTGGTGQALRIAKYYKIPIFDIGKYDKYNVFKEWVEFYYKL